MQSPGRFALSLLLPFGRLFFKCFYRFRILVHVAFPHYFDACPILALDIFIEGMVVDTGHVVLIYPTLQFSEGAGRIKGIGKFDSEGLGGLGINDGFVVAASFVLQKGRQSTLNVGGFPLMDGVCTNS